jgi:hypothetical protein
MEPNDQTPAPNPEFAGPPDPVAATVAELQDDAAGQALARPRPSIAITEAEAAQFGRGPLPPAATAVPGLIDGRPIFAPRPRPRLDEASFRRPDFEDGTPIRLADGQEWIFPRPYIRFVPAEGEGGTLAFGGRRRTLGPAFDRFFGAMIESDDETTQATAALNLAATMLLHNYDLDIGHIQTLLAYDPDSDESAAVWERIVDVAMGTSPKASAVGSDAP